MKLAVYDPLGREVAVLGDAAASAGAHSVTFDGTGLPSGVYFYRLQGSGAAESRRMALVK